MACLFWWEVELVCRASNADSCHGCFVGRLCEMCGLVHFFSVVQSL
jgi:hypothetical protein